MKATFSKHALEQIKLRGIDQQSVINILENPAQQLAAGDLTIFQGLIAEDGRDRLIRIFVNLHKQPPLVATVYKTSKLNKYWQ